LNGVQIVGSGVAGAVSNGNGVQIILGSIAGANVNIGGGLQIVTGSVAGANTSGGWQKINGQITSSGSGDFNNLKAKYTGAIQDLEDAISQGSGEEKDIMERALQILQSGLNEINNF
jgi:hypothetical protein